MERENVIGQMPDHSGKTFAQIGLGSVETRALDQRSDSLLVVDARDPKFGCPHSGCRFSLICRTCSLLRFAGFRENQASGLNERSSARFTLNEPVTIPREVEPIRKRLSGLAARRAGFTLGLQASAGMGKTFTVLEVLKGASCRTVSVRAVAPVSKLIQILPHPKRLAVWVERELEQPEPSLEPIMALLLGLAPLVIHVEDLHETSTTQLEFWQALARGITQSRGLALIATSRTALPEPFETIMLEPLSSEASVKLLEQEVAATLPAEATAWIHARAAGNPLFTLEFFRSLTRRGFVWSDGSRWHWRTPDRDVLPVTVEAMIERTINEACTDDSTRIALEARAYLEHFEPNLKLEQEVWAQVTGLEWNVLESAERNLRAGGVLGDSGFVHPLFREVPIKNLSGPVRQSFARNALEVLPLETGALFIEDAQFGPERSLGLLRKVANKSKTPGRWLALAVEFSSGEDRARLALEAARQLVQSDLKTAEQLYRIALENNSDFAVTLEFIAFLTPHQPREAQGLFERLPGDVRASDSGLVVRFGLMSASSNFVNAVALWQNELGSRSDLDPDVLVHVIWALKSLTRFDDAIDLANRVLARSDLLPWQRARVLNRQSSAYGESSRYARALELVNQVLALLELHGFSGRDVILFDRALYRKQLGDFRTAARDLEQALVLALEVGRTPHEMLIRSFLGSMNCEFGEYALAEEFLLEAFEYQVRHPVSMYLCDTVHNLIELYLAWQNRPSSGLLAQKYARLSLESADAMNMPAYLAASRAYAGFVELEHGSAERALALALEAQAFQVSGDLFFGRWFPTWLEGRARAKLGEHDQAIALLEQTVIAFEKIGRMFEANQAGLDLDRLQNNLESAQGRLEWFKARGMKNAADQGLRLFPELSNESSNPELRVGVQLQVLGTMQIAHESKTESVRGQKRKELLVVLLEARILGRSEVTMLELFDVLYPNVSESEAASGLKQSVFKVRSSYGQNTITTTTNGYALGAITSDAETFLRDTSTQLWRGPYLQDANLEPSASVLEVLTLALHAKAKMLLESDPKEAARVGRILLEIDPYDLNGLRLVCQALRNLENHRSLVRTYSDSRSKLLEVGESLPERWQDFFPA
jgi:tetratricopeptide (TPR) repeat protein